MDTCHLGAFQGHSAEVVFYVAHQLMNAYPSTAVAWYTAGAAAETEPRQAAPTCLWCTRRKPETKVTRKRREREREREREIHRFIYIHIHMRMVYSSLLDVNTKSCLKTS